MAIKERAADPATELPLTEHLRELRNRLLRCALAIAIGTAIGWVYYPVIFNWISDPFNKIVAEAQANGHEITLALTGVADPFILQIQMSALAGMVLSSPIWLYQVWRFVTPGLHRHERRWAIGFSAVATPLFAAGVALAYAVLPYGLEVLFGFTPDGVENIVSVDKYLSFFVRTILIFGVGFLVPLLLVLLNFASVLTGKRLIGWWRWIILVVLVFAAVATPTGDPINLLLLAVPVLALVAIAVGVCLLNDRRRARVRRSRGTDFSELDDDETSPLSDEDFGIHDDT